MINTYLTILGKKTELAKDIWLLRFKLQEPSQVSFLAGQYMILHIPDTHVNKLKQSGRLREGSMRAVTEKGGVRQYSICSSPLQTDGFDLLIGLVEDGLASSYFQQMEIRDTVSFTGPAGVFTLNENEKNKIFLATGTGIAPVKSIIETILNSKFDLANGGTKLYLFWGLKNDSEIYFLDDFKKLAEQNPNFHFKICLSRQTDFSHLDNKYFAAGRVNTVAEKLITGHAAEYEYYLCGDQVIVEALRQFVMGLGVKKEAVFFEKFV